jgi:hypothetical protein
MRKTDALLGDLDHMREDRVTKIVNVELVKRGAKDADRRLDECRDGERRRLHARAHALQPLRDRVAERAWDRQLAQVLRTALYWLSSAPSASAKGDCRQRSRGLAAARVAGSSVRGCRSEAS